MNFHKSTQFGVALFHKLFFFPGAEVKHFLIRVKLLKAHNDYNAKLFREIVLVEYAS